MIPRHHPSEELLAACASGALRPGAALIVRAHLVGCPACRAEAGLFESLGGALLEAEPPAPLAADALERALAAIEVAAPAPRVRARPASRDAAALPPGLDGLVVGKRRWMAPGVWITPVKAARRSRELIYLLRINGGMVLPRHAHEGCEFTCVLEGSFSDSSGRYAAGDFVSADHEVEHSPVVAHHEACICLISTDAPLRMRSLVGRLLQPFAGV